MDQLTLVIGNKNYSSWSLRPWLVLKYFNIPFTEVKIPLYRKDTAALLAPWSPSGLVPVLKHGELTVWESLAICEYLQELYPDYPLWPRDLKARAVARSVSAEMHSGFVALRSAMPMNCRLTFPGRGLTDESRTDLRRITAIWHDCREKYGRGGPMLFGEFTIADAMYAPVAQRFRTYGVTLDPVSEAYTSAVLSLPAMKEWLSAAAIEPETLKQYDSYSG